MAILCIIFLQILDMDLGPHDQESCLFTKEGNLADIGYNVQYIKDIAFHGLLHVTYIYLQYVSVFMKLQCFYTNLVAEYILQFVLFNQTQVVTTGA